MALATFKNLCLDAVDGSRLGSFWAAALGLDFHPEDDGDAVLLGSTSGRTIWINQVPEPKVHKHRVHLDVHGTSPAALVELGADVVDAVSFPWIVMADPEGGEFCLFRRQHPPTYRLYEVAVDVADHDLMSRWWVSVLGGQRRDDERGFSFIEQMPGAPFESISFAPVEEPKQVKNRVHLDVVGNVDALIAAGAVLLRARDDVIGWDVLADPEGNKFCLFAPG